MSRELAGEDPAEVRPVVEVGLPPDRITCPVCGMTSYHPVDIREGYCGNCHDWTSPPRTA
jgi:hypothetical protein